jgi:protease-4|tara:strand:- start:1350 stop:2294 length:945 start_codon:yes stop_codon:yes gene_type:complete
MAKNTERKSGKWTFIIVVLVVLTLISFIFAGFVSLFIDVDLDSLSGNVALIKIKGPIVGEKGGGLLFEDVTSSNEIRRLVRRADKNPNIKAIIFEINSPGGTAVASDEIAEAVKKTNKTTVAWIREIGTSGAYWIASATDEIVANRMSITGSIGVIASYLQFGDFLTDHNVSYERLVSGQFKDIGSPFKDLTPKERALFQKSINKIHDYFVEEVATNRNLKKKDVEKLASGLFYIGSEAKELGLVDTLGGRDEVIEYIEQELDIEVEIVRYRRERSFLDVFADVSSQQSFYIGRGIASGFFTKAKLADSVSILT